MENRGGGLSGKERIEKTPQTSAEQVPKPAPPPVEGDYIGAQPGGDAAA